MSKFTNAEKSLVKSIVATLTLKRISDNQILEEIEKQTNKSLSRTGLYYLKQSIKRDSAKWYVALRNSEYSYIHEFRERIREIEYLQMRHYKIIDENTNSPSIIQKSLESLHTLNVTLSNYYDIAPYIIPKLGADLSNGHPIPTTQQDKEIIV